MINVTTDNIILGTDIKEDHRYYRPAEGMAIIYKYDCRIPETNITFPYVGSTKGRLIDRMGGEDYRNYAVGNSKMAQYRDKYGYMFITPCILCVVPELMRDKMEQKYIDEFGALEDGLNTIRVVKEVPAQIPVLDNPTATGYKKNAPTINGVEDYALTIRHRDGSTEVVTINRGLYEQHYEGRSLFLDTPGEKGHVCISIKSDTTASGRTNKTMLSYLAEDLGYSLRFGPAGSHVLTLDNIYLTKNGADEYISIRNFLKQNPQCHNRVPYLTLGSW